MRRRRVIALAAAIALLLAIAGVFRWHLATPALPSVANAGRSDPAPRQPPAIVADPHAPPAAARAPAPSGSLALATAQDLRQRARYPRSSQPLRAGEEDPILRDRAVTRSAFPGPDGEDPALTAFPDQVSFEPPDAVILYAYLTTAGTRVPAQSIAAEVIDEAGRQLARVEYADDGIDSDRHAGDFVYTARLSNADSEQLAGGAYVVRVHALSADGIERMASTGFLLSRPDAQLTGRYTDAIVAGNLEVQAELQVRRAGRFHLQGTLYTEAGEPLAWAQNALTLEPGTQWIPLSFFGLILHERGDDGPYALRFVALSTTTSMPNAKNRLVEDAYVTGPYRAAEFSDRPYDDPGLIDAAERLERGAAAAPALAADASPQDAQVP